MTASPPVEGSSSTPAEPELSVPQIEAPVPGRWIALAVLALAQFVLVLDSTVVNVALPSIQREFDLPEARLAWIVNGYGLAFGGLLLLGGSLGDLWPTQTLHARYRCV